MNGTARAVLGIALAFAVVASADPALARVQPGEVMDNATLPRVGGGSHPLFGSKEKANVFVFFKAGHDRSDETLKQMAFCERALEGRSIHWVAVVSDTDPADAVKAAIAGAGIKMPVLVDVGDALYGKLGIRLHPVVGIADAGRKLVAFEPYHRINYCDIVKARLKHLLGELSDAELANVIEPPKATTATEGAAAARNLNLARMLLKARNWPKALELAQKAAELDARSAPARVAVGDALAGLGRCEEAAKAWAAALELDPADAAALEAQRAPCGVQPASIGAPAAAPEPPVAPAPAAPPQRDPAGPRP